jgi:hypothetical protein
MPMPDRTSYRTALGLEVAETKAVRARVCIEVG